MVSDPYGITEHTAGRRSLDTRDRSRFSTVRLTVTRGRGDRATVSIIVRDVRGGVLQDTRLAVCQIDTSPGTMASTSPLQALQVALATALGHPPAG